MAAQPHGEPIRHKANKTGKKPDCNWDSFSITGLEADLAYFHARLAWIGEPETLNQKAQRDTFLLLIPAIGKILNRLKRKAPVRT